MSTKRVYYAISHGSLTLVFAFDSNQPVRVDPVVSVIQAGQSTSKRRLLCHLQKQRYNYIIYAYAYII